LLLHVCTSSPHAAAMFATLGGLMFAARRRSSGKKA
jgi:hypothetical protein